jgi:hypothetical protein
MAPSERQMQVWVKLERWESSTDEQQEKITL